MPYPPISALPAVPSRNAPSTFSALMDAFLAAFPQMRTEFNALAAYLDTLALATGPGLFQSGSAALPGIAFAGDTDTGLYRPGANQIGIATGGTQRLLLTTAAFQVDLPITGSAVTQSATDATAGRLLKVGDFGLGVVGNAPLLADLDAIDTPSGSYRTIGSGTTGTFPPGASTFGVLMVTRYDANVFQQEYAEVLSPRRWRRSYRTASTPQWTPWRLMYDQATAVGTVSQDSGVPTGALIETGTNANGRWSRWADGTQICWATVELSYNSAADVRATWTYPAGFSSPPSATFTMGNPTGATPPPGHYCGPMVLSYGSNASLRQYRVNGGVDFTTTDTLSVTAIATGRWF